MKKYSIGALLVTVLCFFVFPAQTSAANTTYYIATSGLTANTGTSAASPWPLSKISSTTFGIGDHILFNKGDTFTGTITINGSGAAGSPIVLDDYGTATNNAVLDGAGTTSNSTLKINGSYITVNNLIVQHSQYGGGIVYIGSGLHDVIIYNCYINNGIRGVNVSHSGSGGIANIKILNNYFTDIADAPSHPVGGGSAVQFNNVNGSGQEIAYNQVYTPVTPGTSTTPGVGDVLSLYQSNGTASSYILLHDNKIRGGGSVVYGYDGIGLGDVGGSYQRAYNNILVNTGAAGIQIAAGTNIIVENNKVYSAQFPYSAIGIHYYNVSGLPSNNITVQNNAINWTDSGGGHNQNLFIHNPGGLTQSTATGLVGGPQLATPTGWSTNTANGTVDVAVSDALLPNPLWTGTPWNTAGAVVTPPTPAPTPVPVPPTLTSPIISAITIGTITQTSANLTFTTDQPTTNYINYGTTTSYGAIVFSGSLLSTHTIYLSPLIAGTTYHYQIISATAEGLKTTSSDKTFVTTVAPVTTPVIVPTPPVVVPPVGTPPIVDTPVTSPVITSGGGGGGGNSSIPSIVIPPVVTPGTVATPIAVTSPAAAFTQTLFLGTRNSEVQNLQHYLNTHNFPIAISGIGSFNNETTYFGPATKAAVKKFQAANGIKTTGVVGPQTRAAINGGNVVQAPSVTTATTASRVVVTALNLNVRSTPAGAVIGTISRGSIGTSTATSSSGKWIAVSFNNGTNGWVLKSYVTEY